ncbi:MAG: helix-turn-helix domain-containing protein [Cellulomonadaceae bacterium]|jgi:ribosome-binding protein aMBF1 (putative translation factor)|nr:helix-turn-helix domain-containing protein [Cellulomonadaceae bacterium]
MKNWRDLQALKLGAYTDEERAEYDEMAEVAKARMELAQIVYDARQAAGITQAELSRRAGTRQGVISAIETGTQAPGGVMLMKIAEALGGQLQIDLNPA